MTRDREGGQINQRGSVLILALLIVELMLTWSGGMLTSSHVEQGASLRSLNLVRAFYLAEGGLNLAIHELRTDPQYPGGGYAALGTRVGGYAIAVAPDGPSRRIIRATGFAPSNDPSAPGYATKAIEAIVQVSRGNGPGHAVLGDRLVRLHGSVGDEVTVDSYDSREAPAPLQGGGSLRVATNSAEDGAMTFLGGVVIEGDVVLGPGSDPDRVLQRTPQRWTSISGSVSAAERRTPLEPFEMPALPDQGPLHLAGNEVVTLPGGIYRFQEIEITGHGQLVFTDRAEVYVEGDVRIAGQGIGTAAQLPTNLTLYVKGQRVAISTDADLFLQLHAPDATVEISSRGDLYGAVDGREVIVQGQGDIHYDHALNVYDEALNAPREADPFVVSVLSWREIDP